VPRLDIGGAAPEDSGSDPHEDRFFVRHLIWTHLDERHELGVLLIADRPMFRRVCSALAPLLSSALGGASKEAAAVPEAIAGILGEANPPIGRAAVLVAWDGQVYIGRADGCTLYHYHAGQLSAIPAEKPSPLTIAPGDWIAATCEQSSAKTDSKIIQEDMARASCTSQLAQAWAERGGAVVVVLRAI
jgi:hypothetical protein